MEVGRNRASDREAPEPNWAAFHQASMLVGVWLLVIFIGAYFLQKLHEILLPLLWAFFCMMFLLPCADFFEQMLMRLGGAMAVACKWCQSLFRHRGARAPAAAAAKAPGAEEEAAPAEVGVLQPPEVLGAEEPEQRLGVWERPFQGLVRVVAVLIVLTLFFSVSTLLVGLIVESAKGVKKDLPYYKTGAHRFADDMTRLLSRLSSVVPPDAVEKLTQRVLEGLEGTVTSILAPIFSGLTNLLVQLLMFLLYVGFWLCSPIDINPTVAGLFKRYILLKSLVSALYGLCTWMLLATLQVRLSVVFGLLTALCNFIPEVGPFVAGALPAPIILFDGRISEPWTVLGTVLAGELALKFVFGNIVEVKLIEHQEDMQMHPVAILFFVAFFGWVWGPTGMLLSVPFCAVLKATAQALPRGYRNGLLWVLTGSRGAAAGPADRQLQAEHA